ncbi:GNAT family N-acetyltransferase [Methylocystis parvus]|uniref:N-acetyltransferase n=1 Tax=Methylocystis parvus TaxID=134 RepID=A0A6B8M6I0_9HYPH|nr:N-acetyltransferase [Methylocystis parvus]QGM97945.1 N-acetyltransferase [Methylocystis parvus]WBK01742.1 N-acetyltransferase [Methylocystis parvus OBBP]
MTFELHAPSYAPVAPALLTRPSFAVLDETPADVAAREALLDASFGPARFLKTCERLREGAAPATGLALVAKDEAGDLIATIRLWPIFAGGRRPALLLGPLAVAEHARALGLGAGMMRAALARAQALGHRAVLLVGDEPYYRRFGFERRFTEKLVMPGPVERARFLGLELASGALEGASGRVSAAPRDVSLTLPRAA